MAPFNFHSIQTLEICQADSPIIDVKDGRLVLTATRGEERIMITAPLTNRLPVVAQTVVKSVRPKVKRRHSLIPTLTADDKRVGASNHLAKLNDEKVKEILLLLGDKEDRKNYPNRQQFYTVIGEAFGVGYHTIANIDRGVSWKHVAR
jgi:hypothetical protein